MGFLDAILGRSKPVRPDLDRLFALPSAAVTLQAAAGFRPTGLGSVCFASVEGGAFRGIQEEVRGLLGSPAEFSQDEYGYTWMLARHAPDDTASLVNDLHAVNSSLESAGFGPQLLCSLMGFRDDRDRSLALVYLYKRGTFYPFAPHTGPESAPTEKRDSALELEVRALLADDLEIEADLSRWFPVWGAPGL
ncbi:PspA-associated protein PspAB [Streptomyces rimosus]|uniref:PspA-associated protein PspAB n=1 Tax=Streptomyces rimosus TaxID=1927 RepID=UPI0037D5AAC9